VNIVVVARQVVVVNERLSYLSCQELSRSLITQSRAVPSRVLVRTLKAIAIIRSMGNQYLNNSKILECHPSHVARLP